MTDEDRREVAARLRHEARTCINSVLISPGDALRLADLIDPGESGQNRDRNRDTVQKESPAVQIVPECDREALLALADEIETDGVDCYVVSTQYVLDEYARRIREACGEVVA